MGYGVSRLNGKTSSLFMIPSLVGRLMTVTVEEVALPATLPVLNVRLSVVDDSPPVKTACLSFFSVAEFKLMSEAPSD